MAKHIDVTLEGLQNLIGRMERRELEEGDWAICIALVVDVVVKQQRQQDRMLAKLKAAAGQVVEVQATKLEPSLALGAGADGEAAASGEEATPGAAAAGEAGTSAGDDAQSSAPGTSETKKRHGRKGAAAFVNAKHVAHSLAAGVLGALCPKCGMARLTRYPEKVTIRVVGQPMFATEVHHLEQGRCRICGRVERAAAPAGLCEGVGSSYVVYDWSACAMLVVMHYFAAMPFKRLEALHQGWGIPLADANLWRVVDETDDLLHPLYRALEGHGVARAVSLRIDDTGSKVIELARAIRAELAALELLGESTRKVRTGINATGVFLELPEGVVVLYFTGRHHAGEVLEGLLKRRPSTPGQPPLVKVTDGASKNFAHPLGGELVEASCNAHAFLKFRDLKEQHPAEYAVAGEVYKAVFDNDDEAKARQLSPVERMRFHHERSKPLMEKLKAMCEEKLKTKLVEPSSALWEPLTFIINQWHRLTRFCEAPGVPLDSNLVEQKLIIPVRYLAASFNYQTQTGAEVGDRMMSLIATAQANGVEPVAYLTHCLRNHEALARNPADFLPWVYRDAQARRVAGQPTVATG